jgi:hypothetical protein
MDEERKDVELKLRARPAEDGFDILAISEGEAKGHDIYFGAAVLKAAVPLYEDLPVFIDHPTMFNSPSIRNLAGTLHAPRWNEAERGIQLKLKPAGPASDVLTAVRDAARENPAIMKAVGFSAVVRVQLDGSGNVTKIISVRSVDAVIDPARGGRFLSTLKKKGVCMADEVVLERESTEEGGNQEQLTSNGFEPKLARVKERIQANRQAAAALLDEQARQAELDRQLQQSEAVLVAQCSHLLSTGLLTSRLPEVVQKRIRRQFEGKAFEAEQLQTAIDDAREELSQLTAGRIVSGPARASGMFNSGDQLQAAIEDLLEAPRDADKTGLKVAPLSGIREAYLLTTGDRDFTGGYFPEFALATTANFPVIVKNALNKRLVHAWKKYGEAGYDWWRKVVTVEHFSTLDQVDWTIIGTIGTLPSVAEGGEYPELIIGDNGETSDWSKYGGYVGLTLETILRDNVRAFKRLPDEVAMGAMRNISEQVAALFTSSSGAGPTLSDTGALFNATAVTTKGGHLNLLTTALGTDLTAWRAVETAMYMQPMHVANEVGYYGTGKPQAVKPRYCLVPQYLYGQAADLFLKDWNDKGPNMGYGIEPLVVPEWTDQTDWGAVADPNILPGIMLGEIFGLKPQIFLAGSESDPAMFSNDESRLKVRQFLTVGIGNWRALHKSNVP